MNQGVGLLTSLLCWPRSTTPMFIFLTSLSAFVMLFFPLYFSQLTPSCLTPPHHHLCLCLPRTPPQHSRTTCQNFGQGEDSEPISVYSVLSKTGAQISTKGDPLIKQIPHPLWEFCWGQGQLADD